MAKIGVIVIDGQNDFNDDGSLPVKGAKKASSEIKKGILGNLTRIEDIEITLDCHHRLHIAHPMMFVDKNGNHPNPYTPILDTEFGGARPIWFATHSNATYAGISHFDIISKYLTDLKVARPAFPHMVWPYHCVIGTTGNALIPEINEAVAEWEFAFKSVANKTTKGSFLFAEHFSALKAQVPSDLDPGTRLNADLVGRIMTYDLLIWTGFALDYCLRSTLSDTITELGPVAAKKMAIAEDCTAAVGGDTAAADTYSEFKKLGVSVDTFDKLIKQ